MAAKKTIRVYEVLADGAGQGPAGDGTRVHRFRDERDAQAFASEATCYGRPAKVQVTDAPRDVARRCGVC